MTRPDIPRRQALKTSPRCRFGTLQNAHAIIRTSRGSAKCRTALIVPSRSTGPMQVHGLLPRDGAYIATKAAPFVA